jgi:hypothetical protein
MEFDFDADYFTIYINEYPISDDTVQRIIGIHFWNFIRSSVYMFDHPDFDNNLETEEFIEQCLNPDQREVIHEYIRKNMEMLSDRFFGIPQIKSANV